MPKRRASDLLDDAIEALRAGAPLPAAPWRPDTLALLRVAGDLRDLPRSAFRDRLRRDLLGAAGGGARASAGPPLRTYEEIIARLAELAAGPSFEPQDLRAALSDLPEMSMRFLAALNDCTVGVSQFSAGSHWERHPAADELLHVLAGEVDVTTLTADGPVESSVSAGSIFICPRGLWHRLAPRSPVSLFFATPGEGTEHSDDAIPPPRPLPEHGARRGDVARAGHDIAAALAATPKLTISERTTSQEADDAFRRIVSFNESTISIGSFSGQSPWERHRRDELLHILDGTVDITVLTDDGPIERTIRGGSVFVCPAGLWHRQYSAAGVTALYATPTPSQISFADDPRTQA